MTCNHQWHDATSSTGPEWICAKCKALYSKIKDEPKTVKREWVELTDEEIDQAWFDTPKQMLSPHVYFYCLVAARLKEKNA